MKTLTALLLLLLLPAPPASAAPIYTNLGDEVYQDGPADPFLVEFWSLEPFRYGAFYDPIAVFEPTLANPSNPFGDLWHDGTFYWAKAVIQPPGWPAGDGCGRIQVDADAWDFAGIGRLFVWGSNCTEAPPPPPPSEEEGEAGEEEGEEIAEPAPLVLALVALALFVVRRL